MTNWWRTDEWGKYEEAYGDPPGTRAALLAAAPWETRIVDLDLTQKALWSDVRRSYHSLINGVGREYAEAGNRIRVTHGPLAGWSQRAMIIPAQLVHAKAAEGATRSGCTWELMGEWIDTRNGLLTIAFHGHAPVGFAYFVVHGKWSYYFSGASQQPNLGLALIWLSMLALKEVDVRWCELGWQGQGRTTMSEDGEMTFIRDDDFKKIQAIEFVRRGFGGRDLPARVSGLPLAEKEWAGAVG